MIGPDPTCLGGISRVIKIWETNNFFPFNLTFFSSVSDHTPNKVSFYLRTFFKYFISLFKKIHFVYVHTSSYNSFRRKLPFVVLAILFHKKIILHIHPTHFYKFLCELVGIEKLFILKILRNVNAIIVLTDEMKIKLERLFPNQLFYVLPNAVDFQQMLPPENLHRKHNMLLYLGWYIKEKGVYELVDAIEALVKQGIDIKIKFYGTKNFKKFKEYVTNKSLERHIFVNGWIDGYEKIKVLYTCTAIVLPSYSEGIPNVILEAMATKTPIIATHVGGLKAILDDKENAIIVKAGNISHLAEKIKWCLENSDQRNKIAENAYLKAVKNYSVYLIKNKFERILSEVFFCPSRGGKFYRYFDGSQSLPNPYV